MAFHYDPEIAALLAPMMAAAGQMQPPGNVAELRQMLDAGMAAMLAQLPDNPEIDVRDCRMPADGNEIAASWYSKAGSSAKSAVVYAHGGGMVAGSTAMYDRMMRYYVASTGVPFLNVEYRLAPDHGPRPLGEDLLAGVAWLAGQADALGVDPARIAVMGDSGGGGVAAAAAILARDRSIPLARQILLYPMLDDRTVEPDPEIGQLSLITPEINRMAWSAVLGADRGTDHVDAVRAPGRLTDFAGLAPAYIEVGNLDIYRDEAIRHAVGLLHAGVATELHVYPGIPHGAEMLDITGDFARRVLQERFRAITAL